MDTQIPALDPQERALLVGFNTRKNIINNRNFSFEELENLIVTAGAVPVEGIICSPRSINPAFFIGKGRVADIAKRCEENEIHTVVFDRDLSPAQTRNLEKEIEAKIIDRTSLILEIFALRAHTREGKLQVELAQLKYLLPRLTRMWTHLSRQYGGLRTRGPGEKQLEVDRRKVQARIRRLQNLLQEVRQRRSMQRKRRKRADIPIIGIVGYTNSGKSTLLKSLTDADVIIEDKLFATLDPTTRAYHFPSGEVFLFIDTVGFIRNLPHNLVESFKATLEETREADILLDLLSQIDAVNSVLEELSVDNKPCLLVLNKTDLLSHKKRKELQLKHENAAFISAKYNYGFPDLLSKLSALLTTDNKHVMLRLPPHKSELLSKMYKYGKVLSTEYLDDCIIVDAFLPKKLLSQAQRYRIKNEKY